MAGQYHAGASAGGALLRDGGVGDFRRDRLAGRHLGRQVRSPRGGDQFHHRAADVSFRHVLLDLAAAGAGAHAVALQSGVLADRRLPLWLHRPPRRAAAGSAPASPARSRWRSAGAAGRCSRAGIGCGARAWSLLSFLLAPARAFAGASASAEAGDASVAARSRATVGVVLAMRAAQRVMLHDHTTVPASQYAGCVGRCCSAAQSDRVRVALDWPSYALRCAGVHATAASSLRSRSASRLSAGRHPSFVLFTRSRAAA